MIDRLRAGWKAVGRWNRSFTRPPPQRPSGAARRVLDNVAASRLRPPEASGANLASFDRSVEGIRRYMMEAQARRRVIAPEEARPGRERPLLDRVRREQERSREAERALLQDERHRGLDAARLSGHVGEFDHFSHDAAAEPVAERIVVQHVHREPDAMGRDRAHVVLRTPSGTAAAKAVVEEIERRGVTSVEHANAVARELQRPTVARLDDARRRREMLQARAGGERSRARGR